MASGFSFLVASSQSHILHFKLKAIAALFMSPASINCSRPDRTQCQIKIISSAVNSGVFITSASPRRLPSTLLVNHSPSRNFLARHINAREPQHWIVRWKNFLHPPACAQKRFVTILKMVRITVSLNLVIPLFLHTFFPFLALSFRACTDFF